MYSCEAKEDSIWSYSSGSQLHHSSAEDPFSFRRAAANPESAAGARAAASLQAADFDGIRDRDLRALQQVWGNIRRRPGGSLGDGVYLRISRAIPTPRA